MTYDEQVREDSRNDEVWERQEAYVRKIPRNHDRFYPDSYHVADSTPDLEEEINEMSEVRNEQS